MLYVVAWFIVGCLVNLEEYFLLFLTYWEEWVMLTYFTFAFSVALNGVFEQSKENENKESKLYTFTYSMLY